MIEPMAKVRLVCPRNLTDQVTSLLQELGVLHIESTPYEATTIPLHPQVIDETARRHKAELERLREDLQRLLVLLPEAPPAAVRTPRSAGGRLAAERGERVPEKWEQIAQFVRQVSSRVDSLVNRLKACEDELALLAKYEKALEVLTPFLRLIGASAELDHLIVVLEEQPRGDHVLPLLHEMMVKVTDNRYELFHSRLDERSMAVLLVFPKMYTARIRSLLWQEGINELRLPASVSDKPIGQALRIMLKKKVELPRRASRYRKELMNLALRWRRALQRAQEAVTDRLNQIEAETLFYRTELTTFVYGWVPRRLLGDLIGRIEREFGGTVVLEECPIDRREWGTVPVVLRNPPLIKPFEALTRLIALPRYGSIDPTPYLAIFFPLFYGTILGDVGYGLLLCIVAWTIRRRYGHHPLVQDLSAVFLTASASAVVFGFLFGELFGQFGERIGFHPILNRMEAFIPLLALSLGVGTLHVLLGIALGILWAWRQGERREAFAKLGGLLLVLAFACLIGSLAGRLSREWVDLSLAGLLLSLLIVFAFGGIRGALELHNLVNVLSYLRLMGIGLASAALAFAANTLGAMAGNLLLALLIGGLLHTVNLAFGILSPTIQSLRLHYVEFFENFFAAGGKPYRPFGRQVEVNR